MSKLAYIGAALLAVPTPLLAQAQQAAPAPAKPPSALTDANKVVCRTQEEIGSRLQQHKVCMTNEQWKAYAQEYKDQVREIQSQATVRASN